MGLPGGVKTRDIVAAVIFVVPFFASWITELACGASWENCAPLAWVPLSAADVPYSQHYHCTPKPDGLGDPALSVGSLQVRRQRPGTTRTPLCPQPTGPASRSLIRPARQFAAAIAYLELNKRFSMLPVVAVFVGITSFLFHARNTVPHHRLDLTGVALLAPGLFDTAVAGRWPPGDTTPRRALVALRALLLVASVVALALEHPTMPTWDPLWTITVSPADRCPAAPPPRRC